MNLIFAAIVFIAFLTAGWRQLTWVPVGDAPSPMEALSRSVVDYVAPGQALTLLLISTFLSPESKNQAHRFPCSNVINQYQVNPVILSNILSQVNDVSR